MRVLDLPVRVGEHAPSGRRGARSGGHCEAGGALRLDPDEPHVLVVEEVGEHADRVRAAADARDDRFGQPALRLEELRARLAADHGLQLAHDRRVGRRADAEPIR